MHTDEAKRQRDRLAHAKELFETSVDCRQEVRSGVPVLSGTRFPVSMLLANIANGKTVTEIATDMDLDEAKMKDFLNALSICFDQPFFML